MLSLRKLGSSWEGKTWLLHKEGRQYPPPHLLKLSPLLLQFQLNLGKLKLRNPDNHRTQKQWGERKPQQDKYL